MSEFKVDKGVPFQERRHYTETKYPWNEMEVGDSFLVPVPKDADREEYHRQCSNIGSVARGYALRNPEKKLTFKPRIVTGGVRVWRVPYEG